MRLPGVSLCLCGVLGQLAPVHGCARSVCCVGSAVSRAPWLLFGGVVPLCAAFLCSVLRHLTPVHRCAHSVGSVAYAVSMATWPLFTGVPALRVVVRLRCPGPLGPCSPVCPLIVVCSVCGAVCHLAPFVRCASSVCWVACAVSWATWLLFTGVRAPCVALLMRCPRPFGSCSPVCLLCVLSLVCGVLGNFLQVALF